MDSILKLIFLNKERTIDKEKTIECPDSYFSLILAIENETKENFRIFIFNLKNQKEYISNEEEFLDNKNYVYFYIQEFNENEDELNKSDYSLIYDKLSESQKDIFDRKFCCSIGYERIKNENPYFCYQCQNIICKEHLIHENEERQPLLCPFCRYELPLEKWRFLKNFMEKEKKEIETANMIINLKEEIKIKNIIIDRREQIIEQERKEKEKYKKENESLLKQIKKLKNKVKNNQVTQFNENTKNINNDQENKIENKSNNNIIEKDKKEENKINTGKKK